MITTESPSAAAHFNRVALRVWLTNLRCSTERAGLGGALTVFRNRGVRQFLRVSGLGYLDTWHGLPPWLFAVLRLRLLC